MHVSGALQVRQHLGRLPSINPATRTLILTGSESVARRREPCKEPSCARLPQRRQVFFHEHSHQRKRGRAAVPLRITAPSRTHHRSPVQWQVRLHHEVAVHRASGPQLCQVAGISVESGNCSESICLLSLRYRRQGFRAI